MQRPYRFIVFKVVGNVYCVRLQSPRVQDLHMDDLSAELGRLLDEENCQKMVLNLGPDEPDCLISIFLAQLINLHRRLAAVNGALTLAHASEYTRNIFRIAGIEKFFDFYPDEQSALRALE